MTADSGRELLMLGLLRRSQLSAYDVDRIVRDHVPLYHEFKRGNVYHALASLATRRLVLKRELPAKRGPRGVKQVYRLSAAGEKRFHELLHDIVCDAQVEDGTLEVAYVLLGQLPRAAALGLLREREGRVVAHERRLGRFFGDVAARGGSALLAANHAVERARAEQQFLRVAIDMLRSNRWEPAWQSDDGPVTSSARKI